MPRKQKKYHFIYETTCKITGRFYVGMHSTDNLEDGYLGSGRILRYSIDKYGKEEHIREILEFLPDRKSLTEREAKIIDKNFLEDSLCMNLATGGCGEESSFSLLNDGSPEHIARCRKGAISMNRALWSDPEWVKRKKNNLENFQRAGIKAIREKYPNGIWKGKTHSDETKEKIGKANSKKERKILSLEPVGFILYMKSDR